MGHPPVDLANPQTLNRYAIVGNMPMSYIDPTGLTWFCDVQSLEGGGWVYTNCEWFDTTTSVTVNDNSDGCSPSNLAACPPTQNPPLNPGQNPGNPGNPGAPNNGPTPTPAPPQGNSWSHPFTPPTCHQWTLWAASDGALSYVTSGAGKYWNPVSATFGGAAVIEAFFAAKVCP